MENSESMGMTAIQNEALERRRVQNRTAQRRFRQRKQEHQKPTEMNETFQNDASSCYPEAMSSDVTFEDFALSPSDGPLLPVDYPSSPHGGSSPYARYSLPDSSGSISFADMDSDFTQYDTAAPGLGKLPTCLAGSTALDDILEPTLAKGPGSESSAVRSENVRRFSREKGPESTRTATTILNESPSPNSSVQSSTSTTTDILSTRTDSQTSLESNSSNSGWMSTLHMAAQQGHSKILKVRKQLPSFKSVFYACVSEMEKFFVLIQRMKVPKIRALTLHTPVLQRNMNSNECDSDGLTPMMHAATGGHSEVTSVLLAHGARLGDVDRHRRSALHWAVLAKHEALLRLLLKHAGNDLSLIDGYDDAGRTPLHTAVGLGFEACVAVLLESGANMHTRARKPQRLEMGDFVSKSINTPYSS